jgi:predicted dehydrogenase
MAVPPLSIAVIGLGHMGARHARCVAAHPDAVLTAVVDVDDAKRDTLAQELKCTAYDSADGLTGVVQAAVIATPTATHATFAAALLANGIGCLVEKPFVATAEEGKQVIATAQAANSVVQVGHIERFNPALVALLARMTESTVVRSMTARRISGASARVTDIDVVMDLMVHDIDAVLAVKRKPVVKVEAKGDKDEAQAWVTFGDGTVADLTASRAQPDQRIRDLVVTMDDGTFAVDYIGRTLAEVRRDGGKTPMPVKTDDALTAQLSAFIAAVRGGGVIVPADDAVSVMDVAWRVQRCLGLAS